MIRFCGICFLICMIAAAASGFVYLIKENSALTSALDDANSKIAVLKAEKEEAEKVLKAQHDLEKEINEHRQKIDAAVEDACGYNGADRIEYLLRVLNEDAASRCGKPATAPDGAVPGAGGK